MMKKLIVKLPAFRKSTRLVQNRPNQNQSNGKQTSKERTRQYRQRIQNNQRKLEKVQKKKKNQNKAYKEKQKRKRILDAEFNDDFKIKQRKWKQASRKRRAEQKKKEGCTNTNTETKDPKQSRVRNYSSGPALRKRAERARKILPESPTAWASTMKHIIKNATPRRQKGLLEGNTESDISNILNITGAGRPSSHTEKAKRSLAFADDKSIPESIWKNKKKPSTIQDQKGTTSKKII